MSRYVESGTLDAASPARTGLKKTIRTSTWFVRWFIPKPVFADAMGIGSAQDSPSRNRRSPRQKSFHGNGQFHQALLRRTTDPCGSGIFMGCDRGQKQLKDWSTPSSKSRKPQHDSRPRVENHPRILMESCPQLIANKTRERPLEESENRADPAAPSRRSFAENKVGIKLNVPRLIS